MGAIALAVSGLHTKYVCGVLLVVPCALGFAFDLRKFMLGCFLLLVPVALNISPFYLDLNAPEPLHHGVDKPTLQIWVSQLPFALLLALWLLAMVMRKTPCRLGRVSLLALPFIAWSALSVFYSPRPDLAAARLSELIFYYVLYLYMINQVCQTEELRFTVYILILGLLVEAVLAMVQYWGHLPFSIGEGVMGSQGVEAHQMEAGVVYRVRGTVGQPNTFGLYIAMILPLAFSLFLGTRLGRDLIALLGLCFGLVALAMTFSRAGWLGAFSGCLLTGYLLLRRGLIRLRVAPAVVSILILVLVLSLFLGGPLYRRITASPSGVTDDRWMGMEVACEMIRTHPIAGVGLNAFVDVMTYYDKTGVSDYFPMPVHNMYLHVAAETGLVGLSLFIGILLIVFSLGLRAYQRSAGHAALLITGLLGSLLAAVIYNLFDCNMAKYVGGMLVWIFLGLIEGVCIGSAHLPAPGCRQS